MNGRENMYVIKKKSVLAHVVHYVALTVLVVIAVYGGLAVLDATTGNVFRFASSQSGLVLISVATIISLVIISIIAAHSIITERLTRTELEASHNREDIERSRIFTLIDSIPDAVFSIDHQGVVESFNSGALNMLDTNAEVFGRPINELIHLEKPDGTPVDLIDELAKTTVVHQRDDLIMRIDANDTLLLEVTFAPIQGGSESGDTTMSYMLLLRDITRIKSLEEERDEFISVVSHELRTPIAIAEGSLDNAQLLAERGLGDKTTDAISEAHKQVLFLARMINDLSTLSRAERGVSDEAEDIDITELAHQLHAEYVAQAEEKGLHLDLDIQGKPQTLHVSRLYLQELLQNFITNAIKYTPKGSVTLRIIPDARTVQFEVVDTGIGIGKADLANIFKRFYRAEDYRTRETNGTGLGLYVASKLAKKLRCKINVISRLNHGSTFSFSLPVKPKSRKKRTKK